ncbi:hypothetical protein TWF281_009804 [Arthrobotrys megalospora]
MRNSRSRPCLTSLPTEIQLEIFSYLTDMDSQSSLYGTCALWRRLLTRYTIFLTARYYRGRAPYIYFPVVHRFFDISPRGNGRCQVYNGAITNYQYKTEGFGYMDVSELVMNDAMFSPMCGPGWWAPNRQGMGESRIVTAQYIKVAEVGLGNTSKEDAEGAYSPAAAVDTREINDAIWMHIKIAHDYEREAEEPQSSAWERIALPKRSTIEHWANAILEVAKLHLREAGKGSICNFNIDFREAFIKSHPAEGWCLDIWIILPESLENQLARLGSDLRDMQVRQSGSRDQSLLLLAIL